MICKSHVCNHERSSYLRVYFELSIQVGNNAHRRAFHFYRSTDDRLARLISNNAGYLSGGRLALLYLGFFTAVGDNDGFRGNDGICKVTTLECIIKHAVHRNVCMVNVDVGTTVYYLITIRKTIGCLFFYGLENLLKRSLLQIYSNRLALGVSTEGKQAQK